MIKSQQIHEVSYRIEDSENPMIIIGTLTEHQIKDELIPQFIEDIRHFYPKAQIVLEPKLEIIKEPFEETKKKVGRPKKEEPAIQIESVERLHPSGIRRKEFLAAQDCIERTITLAAATERYSINYHETLEKSKNIIDKVAIWIKGRK